jgi:SAM-dependent methyltransferase
MQKSWYKKWFNTQQYLDLYKHRDKEDAKKIVSLLFNSIKFSKGAECLDLACGNGRHSVLFAMKGLSVTGLDLSAFLINQAKKRLTKEYRKYKKNLYFMIGDMKHLKFKNKFDIVVNLFSSFGYFSSDKENFSVINGVSKALKRNGFFLFDFLNKNHLKRNLVPYNHKLIGNTAFIQIRHFENSFVVKNIFIIKNSKFGKPPKIHQFFEKIRLYSFSDFKREFRKNGLQFVKVFGDYSGKPFNSKSSERLIILAQKTK